MSRRSRSSLARVAGAALLAATLSGCMAGEEFTRGYVLDERSVSQIRPGLAPEQVLQTLGTPSTVSTVGNKTWYYISQVSRRRIMFMGERFEDQRVTAVYFDRNFKVERIAVYGLQEGKVFDFISRTTPSGGSDQNFIGQLFRGLGTFIPNT